MSISVIIPVFNIEKYLVRNIESMIGQKGDEIEFIYINDGSTDSSLQILHEYESKDERIRVITQKNRGLSAARNRGIQEATGDIVVFVDGDDYIVDDSLEILQMMMQKDQLDILLADEIRVHVEAQENPENKKIICGDICAGMDLLLANQAVFTGCLYVYRRMFLEKYEMRFREGILHEDMEFLPRALFYAKRVMKTNYSFYFHVMREGSITNTKNIRRSKDLIRIAGFMEKFCNENTMSMAERAYFADYSCFLYAQGIHVGILNGYSIKDLMDSEEIRKRIAEELSFGSLKYRIISAVLKYKLDGFYSSMYRLSKYIMGITRKFV